MSPLCLLLASSVLARTPLAAVPTEIFLVYETGSYEVKTDHRGLVTLAGTVADMEGNGWLALEDKDILVLFHDSVSRRPKYEALRAGYDYFAQLSPSQATVRFGDFPPALQRTLEQELSSLKDLSPVPSTLFGIQPYVTLKLESPELAGPVRLTVFGHREEDMSPALESSPLTLAGPRSGASRQPESVDWDHAMIGPVSVACVGRRGLRGDSSTSRVLARAWGLLDAWQRQFESDIDSKRTAAFDQLVEELKAQSLKQLHTGQLAMSLPSVDRERALSYLQVNGSHGGALSLADAQRALQSARVTAMSRGIAVSFACPSRGGGCSIGLVLVP